jgi:hypothetical protein
MAFAPLSERRHGFLVPVVAVGERTEVEGAMATYRATGLMTGRER